MLTTLVHFFPCRCQEIVVLDVSTLISWTSYMVFCSVFSKPQLMAALARVEKMSMERFSRQQQNTPGNSPWECLDYGDCLVHVMSAEQVRMPNTVTTRWTEQFSILESKAHEFQSSKAKSTRVMFLYLFPSMQREFYDIESFYGAAEEVDLPFIQQATSSELKKAPVWSRDQPMPVD